MKKLFFYIIALFLNLLEISSTFAQTQTQKLNEKQLEILFKDSQKTSELNALPKADILTEIVPGLIKLSLQLAGVFGFVMAVYAGILLVTARGDEESVKKGRDILLYSIIAIAVISAAFAIVSGIVNFRF